VESCPCGSGREYAACCGAYIEGRSAAPTAEALMRSRYVAYVKGAIAYIVGTCVKDSNDIDEDSTKRWSEKAVWRGLEIKRVEKGGQADTEGLVEFVANYEMDGLVERHHEIATFRKEGQRWLFATGELLTETVVRAAPKVGRNDPCPCGSGRKYKQCCGR